MAQDMQHEDAILYIHDLLANLAYEMVSTCKTLELKQLKFIVRIYPRLHIDETVIYYLLPHF